MCREIRTQLTTSGPALDSEETASAVSTDSDSLTEVVTELRETLQSAIEQVNQVNHFSLTTGPPTELSAFLQIRPRLCLVRSEGAHCGVASLDVVVQNRCELFKEHLHNETRTYPHCSSYFPSKFSL